jgi:transglutaminase-like putative cysteine protease/phosphatidylserine synthase
MTAAGATASVPRPLTSDPTLSVPVARGLAFVGLAGFGALHWMVLLDPAAPDRALYALAAAGVAILGLLAVARIREFRLQQAAAAGVALVALAFAILGGGVADELLRPDLWGSLASGINRGVAALPGVRVPYRGLDEWIRIVLPLGGTVLVTAAAILAFWPRRNRIGFPIPALTLLVALYAVPAVSLDFENEFLRGAALALLVLAFLRLEKLRVGDASNAGLVAAGVAVLALMLAPALDKDAPWWDYERWALGAASARSTSFSWDHDYGPLDWPRDGRELLRVKAQKRPAYWKAANLSGFDGLRWVQDDTVETDPGVPENAEAIAQGTQEIKVTIRNLSSRVYITAGYTDLLEAPTIRETGRRDGTWVAGRTLRRGDAYSALVYTPFTNESQRREAGNEIDRADLAPFRALILPASGDRFQSGAPRIQVLFPAFGVQPQIFRGVAGRDGIQLNQRQIIAALEQGPYRRTWALSQELRNEAETQEDLVQSVLTYLRRGFAYTETPTAAAFNLDGFLFDAKAGYCQQFSGAMALLLRMAGVPTRVVTGFTSGSLDSKTKEYVVRDLDAHSWVEVWYKGIGWVTFDPTPAAAPARSQPNDGGTTSEPGASVGPPSLGGDLPSDPGRRAAAPDEGTSWVPIALIALGGLAALALLTWLFLRRRRRAGTPQAAMAIAELERALRRTRRHPGPGTTLHSLEERFARSPAAAGYVRAVRDLRYGGRPASPTPAQRRGLRAELARGMGLTGRLRAWWALPPRAH